MTVETFSIFHLYLLFFLLGVGYAAVAGVLGQLSGGHGHGAGDTGSHAEASHADADSHDPGAGAHAANTLPNISPLSPVTIATFVASFGGIGLLLDRLGLPGTLSFPAAAGSGFVIAAAAFFFFYQVFRFTQSNSGVSGRQAIGAPADVITPIPEKGTGEIAYILGGRRFNGPARTVDGRGLKKGTGVVIVGRSAGIFSVREKAHNPGSD